MLLLSKAHPSNRVFVPSSVPNLGGGQRELAAAFNLLYNLQDPVVHEFEDTRYSDEDYKKNVTTHWASIFKALQSFVKKKEGRAVREISIAEGIGRLVRIFRNERVAKLVLDSTVITYNPHEQNASSVALALMQFTNGVELRYRTVDNAHCITWERMLDTLYLPAKEGYVKDTEPLRWRILEEMEKLLQGGSRELHIVRGYICHVLSSEHLANKMIKPIIKPTNQKEAANLLQEEKKLATLLQPLLARDSLGGWKCLVKDHLAEGVPLESRCKKQLNVHGNEIVSLLLAKLVPLQPSAQACGPALMRIVEEHASAKRWWSALRLSVGLQHVEKQLGGKEALTKDRGTKLLRRYLELIQDERKKIKLLSNEQTQQLRGLLAPLLDASRGSDTADPKEIYNALKEIVTDRVDGDKAPSVKKVLAGLVKANVKDQQADIYVLEPEETQETQETQETKEAAAGLRDEDGGTSVHPEHELQGHAQRMDFLKKHAASFAESIQELTINGIFGGITHVLWDAPLMKEQRWKPSTLHVCTKNVFEKVLAEFLEKTENDFINRPTLKWEKRTGGPLAMFRRVKVPSHKIKKPASSTTLSRYLDRLGAEDSSVADDFKSQGACTTLSPPAFCIVRN
jgi:hypothetical protein